MARNLSPAIPLVDHDAVIGRVDRRRNRCSASWLDSRIRRPIADIVVIERRLAARFTPHTIDTGLTGGYQVVVSDLNRDGRPDVIALASGLTELRWYQNPGWQRHVLVTGITQAINVAAYDVDGDGIPELALAHEFSNVYAQSRGIVSILTHQGIRRARGR